MTIMNANKILIIDDDTVILDFLIELLQDEVSVSYTSEGGKALELAKLHKPDLILLDVMMPGMDGFEVCKRLKADPDTQPIPVVFITAKSDENDITLGLELGAIDYITKPFDPDIIVVKIRNILTQITATRSLAEQQTPQSMSPADSGDRRAEGTNRPDRIPKAAAGSTHERRADGERRPDRIAKEELDNVMERRALGAARSDRFEKPFLDAPKGMSLAKFLVIALLVAIVGGGGYAWYSNAPVKDMAVATSPAKTQTAAPAKPQEVTEDNTQPVIPESNKQTQQEPQATPFDPTADACEELPKVAWWGNATHESITNYVNNKADSDWDAYIAKWEGQLEKLVGVQAKGGTVIAPKLGTRLTGPSLAQYITQVETRIKVTRCLAAVTGGTKP